MLVLVCGYCYRLEEMVGVSSTEDFPANEQSLLAEMSGATSNFPGMYSTPHMLKKFWRLDKCARFCWWPLNQVELMCFQLICMVYSTE